MSAAKSLAARQGESAPVAPALHPGVRVRDERRALRGTLELLGKSAQRGAQPLSLEQHTWEVVGCACALMRSTPLSAQDRSVLYWGAWLHDAGKVMGVMQRYLKGHSVSALVWPRHEVGSLALLGGFDPQRAGTLARMIATHHKDLSGTALAILTLYSHQPSRFGDNVTALLKELDLDALRNFTSWAVAEARAGLEPGGVAYRLGIEDWSDSICVPLTVDEADTQLRRILKMLRDWSRLSSHHPGRAEDVRHAARLRGLLIRADRLASSGAGVAPLRSLELRLSEGEVLRSHQARLSQVSGSALMRAPTGSGKTEASLAWACAQREAVTAQGGTPGPLLLLLPYTASATALRERLSARLGIPKEEIGLLHGRAMAVLTREAGSRAKQARSLHQLLGVNVLVATPWQLLKILWAVPGHEMIRSLFDGSQVVFDEVHAYQPRVFGYLLELIRELRRHDARILVMTATLPGWTDQLLREALELGPPGELERAEYAALSDRAVRHCLQVHPGSLRDEVDQITGRAQAGEQVLVIVNSVRSAQELTLALRRRGVQVTCLHARFRGKDRGALEDALRRQLDPRREPGGPGGVTVTTQVVEVSLDISADVLFTQVAPLEALLQRLGRLNRPGHSGLPPAEAHVFLEGDGDQEIGAYVLPDVNITGGPRTDPMKSKLMGNVRSLLSGLSGEVVRDEVASTWLDQVYQGTLDGAVSAFLVQVQSGREFARARLAAQHPLTSNPDGFKELGEQFDGVSVVHEQDFAEYEALIQASRFVDADELLIPVSLIRDDQVTRREVARQEFSPDSEGHQKVIPVLVTAAPYDPQLGLVLTRAVAEQLLG